MLNGVSIGMVGYQADRATYSKRLAKVQARWLYRRGRLPVAAAIAAGVGPSDHGAAVASGRVTVADLLAAGVDLQAADRAYRMAAARKAGGAGKAGGLPSYWQAKRKALAAIAAESPTAARVVAQVKAAAAAKREAAKGRTYTAAEIAALQATLRK